MSSPNPLTLCSKLVKKLDELFNKGESISHDVLTDIRSRAIHLMDSLERSKEEISKKNKEIDAIKIRNQTINEYVKALKKSLEENFNDKELCIKSIDCVIETLK